MKRSLHVKQKLLLVDLKLELSTTVAAKMEKRELV
jgi:hypothetical protein